MTTWTVLILFNNGGCSSCSGNTPEECKEISDKIIQEPWAIKKGIVAVTEPYGTQESKVFPGIPCSTMPEWMKEKYKSWKNSCNSE